MNKQEMMDKIIEKIKENKKAATAYVERRCTWTRCDDWDYSELWSTSCGQEFDLTNGYTPADNRMKYCCFCGKPLEEGE